MAVKLKPDLAMLMGLVDPVCLPVQWVYEMPLACFESLLPLSPSYHHISLLILSD